MVFPTHAVHTTLDTNVVVLNTTWNQTLRWLISAVQNTRESMILRGNVMHFVAKCLRDKQKDRDKQREREKETKRDRERQRKGRQRL